MKYITILICTVSFISCKKCYQCETATDQMEVCSEDPLYEEIEKGDVVTDASGNIYDCTLSD